MEYVLVTMPGPQEEGKVGELGPQGEAVTFKSEA